MFYFNDDSYIKYNNMRVYEDDNREEVDEVGEYEVELDPYDLPYYEMRAQNQPPTGLPPSFIPSKSQANQQFGGPTTKAVDPGSIRPCLFRFVYIWQTNGRSYWAYLTFAGRKSVAGFRWMGFRWVYFGLDLNRIESFFCT